MRGTFLTVPLLLAAFSQPLICQTLLAQSADGQTSAAPNTPVANTPVAPLRQAHAHNDYHHPRPLADALEHGFCGIEADIFLVDGELLVGHDRSELTPQRTLQGLYLEPIRQRARRHGGRVYPDGPTIMLLVDIKADGEEVYAVLDALLESYRDIVSGFSNGQYHRRAVQVVISGDRPKEQIRSDTTRYAGIDGRLSDLDSDLPSEVMPLISDRWSSHFDWRGEGQFPTEEREKLASIVRQAHRAGRRVRFWATPESPEVWAALLAHDVDHVNTDKLAELEAFLRRH